MNARDIQSVLHTAGAGAQGIADLWWFMAAVLGLVFVLVMVLLLGGLFRRRDPAQPIAEPSLALWLGAGALALPAAALTAILLFTLDSLAGQGRAEDTAEEKGALTIRVVARRWWWEVTYESDTPQRRVTTANEIVIPAGRPVRVKLESRDLIHSFWVPNLQGKLDIIPGRTNTLVLNADRPGIYRGQCAEFCGPQHANMAFLVVALDESEFLAWYDHQLTEAPEPQDDLARQGRQVFMSKPCVTCHAIRGTMALASAGPDLTHVASRRTLAAGTVPNTRGYLGGWIKDPQGLKPGSHMPNVDLSAEEFLALLAYLETLR